MNQPTRQQHPDSAPANIAATSWRPLAFILLIGALCHVPFINKAVHIDSDMMVYTAHQILVNPLNPPLGEYGRHMVLHNKTEMPASSIFYRCPHPPLVPLLLAPIASLGGMQEWPFHAAMFLFYVLAVGAVWHIFGLFFGSRLQTAGTLLWAISPALLVSSQNIMWDVPVAAFILWGLGLLISARRAASPALFFWAGAAAGLGALTKMTVLPLYAVGFVTVLTTRNRKNVIAWTLPALALPALWVVHNLLVFGMVQYLSTGHLKPIVGDLRYRMERLVSYTGGAVFLPVFWYWLVFVNRKRFVFFLGILICVGVWGALLHTVLHKTLGFSAAYVLFASAGTWALVRACFAKRATSAIGDIFERYLISAYVILSLLTMDFLPLASVRFMLPIVPFVIAVVLQTTAGWSRRHSTIFFALATATTLFFSLCLCYADYLFCEADRRLPAALEQKGYVPAHTWYFGRLSYDYYLYRAGFRNLRTETQKPAVGDAVIDEVVPGDYPVAQYVDPLLRIAPVDTLSFFAFALRTRGLHGGFYGDDRLPYAVRFGVPQKRFVVYRVVGRLTPSPLAKRSLRWRVTPLPLSFSEREGKRERLKAGEKR